MRFVFWFSLFFPPIHVLHFGKLKGGSTNSTLAFPVHCLPLESLTIIMKSLERHWREVKNSNFWHIFFCTLKALKLKWTYLNLLPSDCKPTSVIEPPPNHECINLLFQRSNQNLWPQVLVCVRTQCFPNFNGAPECTISLSLFCT